MSAPGRQRGPATYPRRTAAAVVVVTLLAQPAATAPDSHPHPVDTLTAGQPTSWLDIPVRPRRRPATPPRRNLTRPSRGVQRTSRPAPPGPAHHHPNPNLDLAVSGRAAVVVAFARAQIGKRYVYNTAGPGSYDCSGLVMAAYAQAGIVLPHRSGAIAVMGRPVPAGRWLPGDVVIMPGHVAVFVGAGLMVEAANPHAGVRLAPTRGGYARRFL